MLSLVFEITVRATRSHFNKIFQYVQPALQPQVEASSFVYTSGSRIFELEGFF